MHAGVAQLGLLDFEVNENAATLRVETTKKNAQGPLVFFLRYSNPFTILIWMFVQYYTAYATRQVKHIAALFLRSKN